MKARVMPSMVQMDPELLRMLVAEVKETIATSIRLHEKAERKFTAAEMWNIHRKAKSASAMVRRW